jgi:EmrB/QacA subfamily drug resistance transporter
VSDAARKRTVLLAAILGSGIVFLDGTIVNVALPAIRRSLHGGLAEQQWIVEAYALTLSALLLVGGSLGDLFGRRRVFAIGTAAFGVCSLLCAAAPTSGVLIAARAIQGVAGALLVPNTLALIMDTFAEHERAMAIGSWTAWTGIATVIGPLGGGALVTVASWRWVFAVNVVPVVVTLYLLSTLPGDARNPGRVDWVGAVLVALGLAGPVFALIEQPQYGWGSGRVAIPLIAGIVMLAAFVVVERRERAPMLPFELFASRNFTVGNLTTLTLYAGLGVATFFLVLFLQQVARYTALESGLALLPITIIVFALSKRFGALADRIGPHLFMAAGPIIAGAGLLLLARIGGSGDYVSTVLPGVAVFGLGLAATVAPLTAAVLGSVAPEHAGVASGVNNMVSRVAGLLAIAALGAVITGSFQTRLQQDVNRQHLGPPAHALVQGARTKPLVIDTSAVPAAQRATARGDLVDASVHAFRLGMVISAVLAVLGGLIAALGIENPRRKVECADCPGGALAAGNIEVARRAPAAPVPEVTAEPA